MPSGQPETARDWPSMTVGQRVAALREDRQMSQRELSQNGCSYAYISRIEHGVRTPSMKALRLLAPKLDVPVEFLETGRMPVIAEGPLFDVAAELLAVARRRGIAARQQVRVTLIEVPS